KNFNPVLGFILNKKILIGNFLFNLRVV
ncbi:hypothetical protein VCHC55B2_1072, partial [Vibrio cholerae HC-55B2]